MIKKIDHIAFAVKDLDSSAKLFEKLFNTPSSKTEIVKNEDVKINSNIINTNKSIDIDYFCI